MEFQNKRILITGGAGFIGSNLAIRLIKEKAQVTVLDALIPGTGGNLFNLNPIQEEISFLKMDLRNPEGISEVVRDQEIIFNLVGQVSHQDSITHPLLDMEINIAAQLNLLEACRYYNPSAAVIFTSTRQVYGIPQYLPVDEKHPTSPVDFNGVSNCAGEGYHVLYAKIFGLRTVVLRLTNTYGPRQLIKHSRQGVMGWFINRALTGQPICLFDGGRQMRDFNYVDDVVEALLLAAKSENCWGQVFNLSGERADLVTVAKELIQTTGRGSLDAVGFPEDLKKIDIGDYYGTSEKFSNRTGWRPTTDLKKGFQNTIQYFEKYLDHYLDSKA